MTLKLNKWFPNGYRTRDNTKRRKKHGHKFWSVMRCGSFSSTFRDSEAFRSSLMTADRASGLMPCSHSLTQMDKDSISKPVFSSLEISSRTVQEKRKV